MVRFSALAVVAAIVERSPFNLDFPIGYFYGVSPLFQNSHHAIF